MYRSTAKLLLLLACAGSFLAPHANAARNDRDQVGPGQVAYHYVGRASLDFQSGKGVIFGYFTNINGFPANASLFAPGTPGETTAFFTFRADITFRPLSPNGVVTAQPAVFPVLIEPSDFKMYYNASPNRHWGSADGFSAGQPIASFAREMEQFALIGAIGTNTATALLESSPRFTFAGKDLDMGRIVATGVTNVTIGNGTPLPGSTPTSPTYAFAGYGTAIGR